MTIGIIKEAKLHPDKRVALMPSQCVLLQKQYPNLKILIEPSSIRIVNDEEYVKANLTLSIDLSKCDIIFGIKEVPPGKLIANKKYLFFSHTIKKQPHNKLLLQTILQKNIQLIDYECLVDEKDNRIIGFGRFAGIAGAYNTIRLFGLKYARFNLKPPELCEHKAELEKELRKAKMGNIKILVTGGGRVANGALEILGAMKMRKVTPYEYLMFNYSEPVYAQIHSSDYHVHKENKPWNSEYFYDHPGEYNSSFAKFAAKTDLLLHCAFWDPKAPVLFTLEDMAQSDFKIRVIGDITCDIGGSIPCTIEATTIEQPFYEWEQYERQHVKGITENSISVMAVDNLPCSLPRDASEAFGAELISKVIPSLMKDVDDDLITRASITKDGKLTERYKYLSDYIA